MSGYFQIYTGDGKGKTTSAIGLSIRALGAGHKVFFAQFSKKGNYSEIKALKTLPNITIKQFGTSGFIVGKPTEEDVKKACEGLKQAEKAIVSGKYDLVVLDEANIALYYKLFTVKELINIINKKANNCEIVVTGRNAPKELIEVADLVTEMKEIKHYYSKGVKARIGIEM